MIRKITTIAATALAIGGLTACGGGGSTTPSSTTQNAHMLPVSVSVFVPKAKSGSQSISRASASSSSLKPQYLPTSVNSLTFQQTKSGGSAVAGSPVAVLIIGGASCTPSPGGQTCTVTLQGVLGQDAWLINSYTSGDGTGLALSTNTGSLTVLKGVANVLALTLNPILEFLTFVPIADSTNATGTTTLPLVLEAADTSGAIIIGPGNFVTPANVPNPITLSSSSSTDVVLQTTGGSPATATLTATTDNNLGQISYDGTLFAGSQTVSASATGVPTATFTLTLTLAAGGLSVPPSIAMGADLGTSSALLPISEPGFGGTFTLTSSSCVGIVTFPGTAGPGPSKSPTVTQVGGGTCTILVSDGLGHSGSVTVYSTTIGITLQQHQQR